MEIPELKKRLKKMMAISMIEFPTNSEDYVGMIVVAKRHRGPLTFEDVKPGEEDYEIVPSFAEESSELYQQFVEDRKDAQERPIMVLVMEVDRTVYRGPHYAYDNEYYRRHEVYYFRSIPEVEELLRSFGYGVADLKCFD